MDLMLFMEFSALMYRIAFVWTFGRGTLRMPTSPETRVVIRTLRIHKVLHLTNRVAGQGGSPATMARSARVLQEGTLPEATLLQRTLLEAPLLEGTLLEGTLLEGTLLESTLLEGTFLEARRPRWSPKTDQNQPKPAA